MFCHSECSAVIIIYHFKAHLYSCWFFNPWIFYHFLKGSEPKPNIQGEVYFVLHAASQICILHFYTWVLFLESIEWSKINWEYLSGVAKHWQWLTPLILSDIFVVRKLWNNKQGKELRLGHVRTAKSRGLTITRWLSLVNLVISYIRIEQEEESNTKYNAKYIASLQREIFF